MLHRLFTWMTANERRLSAAAMVAGFIADNLFFDRVDLLGTHLVFLSYIAICVFAIGLLHYLESRQIRPRWRSILPIATQFALGGFWSGFVIFYGKSAVVSASWPFLLLLALIFLGNEVFKRYHERLVFTTTLFFFALYSYAIFAVPVVTHELGTRTFLESGAVAVVAFALFMVLLRILGRERFLRGAWQIRGGALAVLVLINIFYFTSILPPLPLALSSGGIYHSISKTSTGYDAYAEHQSWRVSLGAEPVLHVVPGESLYAYSAIFAPIKLTTTIVHRWEWYDPVAKEWVTESSVSFPISGGRDGGYRGYSTKTNPQAGEWRVDIETIDGRLVGRLGFEVVSAELLPTLTLKALD